MNASRKRLFPSGAILLLAVIAIRLAATGDRDILALNAPYDEYWYVQNAGRLIWGGPYSHMAFAQLPVYSLWLAILHLFGVPARLGIDMAWLFAAGYLAFALYHLSGYRWAAAGTFLFLAFHPYALILFDRSLAETLVAVLSTIALAAGIELWNCRGTGQGVRRLFALGAYALCFALAFHARKEGVVLLAPLALLALWSWKEREVWWSRAERRALTIPLLVAPIVTTLVIGVLLAGANYLRWGLFARYELAATGYQSAVRALNSIDAGRTPRHITITSRVRTLAYEASPTFRELRPFFEGVPGRQVAVESAKDTGRQDEIANGWFYWTLRDAGALAGWHRDPLTAEAKYGAVAEELNAAMDGGKLKRRPVVLMTFLDPDLGKWIEDVPRSVFGEIVLVGWPQARYLAEPREDALPRQLSDFTAITGRRNLPVATSVIGWLVAPAGTVVDLGPSEAAIRTAQLAEPQRPDVPGAYPFRVSAPAGERVTNLHAQAPDGRQGTVALADLREGKMAKMNGTLTATLGVDQLSGGDYVPRLERWFSGAPADSGGAWLPLLCKVYGWIGYAYLLAAGTGILVALGRGQARSALLGVVLLALAAVLARAVVFGILDASSWNGMQARYMFPVVSSFACAGMIGLALTYGSLRRAQPVPGQA